MRLTVRLELSSDLATEPKAQLCGNFAVARKTESAQIIQITLAATLRHGEDMVCVPQRAACRDGLHTVKRKTGSFCCASGALEGRVDGGGIRIAERTNAMIASMDLVTQVAGICAETMLVHAIL